MPDREIEERLSTYIARLESLGDIRSRTTGGVILGRNVPVPYLLDGENEKIIKTPIGWPLWDYKMFYIVDVPADTVIPPHHHNEDLFRLLISGDLEINGNMIEVGEWFVVPSGTTYSIRTSSGYKAVSGYTSICQTSRMSNMHLERSTN